MSSITLEESQDRSEANKPQLTVEELVKTLRQHWKGCDGCERDCGPYNGDCALMIEAADVLESLVSKCNGYKDKFKAALAENTRLAEKIPHWISVNDRLPEQYSNVLICDQNGCEWIGNLHEDNRWHFDEVDEITPMWLNASRYWMPLPEPPKAGETNA